MDKMQIADANPAEAAKDFAIQLFDVWGVGDSGCQNGLLLLLSKQDRQVQIAVSFKATFFFI